MAYWVEDFASDVVPLLDALGVEQAVLAGHSGSCPVARRVAIDAPERVAGLLLEASPTTLRGDVGLQQFLDDVVAGLEDPIDPAFARSFMLDTSSEATPPEVLDHLVDELLKVPARVWKQVFGALAEYDDTAELSRIGVPTVLIWGDADGVVRRDMQDDLVERIPRAALRVYPGVGHTPRWEDPARFASDVADLVDRCRP
jgi:pimeloyl-ACP methyl ester carboxylesterase